MNLVYFQNYCSALLNTLHWEKAEPRGKAHGKHPQLAATAIIFVTKALSLVLSPTAIIFVTKPLFLVLGPVAIIFVTKYLCQ